MLIYVEINYRKAVVDSVFLCERGRYCSCHHWLFHFSRNLQHRITEFLDWRNVKKTHTHKKIQIPTHVQIPFDQTINIQFICIDEANNKFEGLHEFEIWFWIILEFSRICIAYKWWIQLVTKNIFFTANSSKKMTAWISV